MRPLVRPDTVLAKGGPVASVRRSAAQRAGEAVLAGPVVPASSRWAWGRGVGRAVAVAAGAPGTARQSRFGERLRVPAAVGCYCTYALADSHTSAPFLRGA